MDHRYDKILDEWQVKVKWADYPNQDSWEPIDIMISQIHDLVKQYCQLNDIEWYSK